MEKILQSAGVTWNLRSRPQEAEFDRDVLLLDTFGELALVYAVGEPVFVGEAWFRWAAIIFWRRLLSAGL